MWRDGPQVPALVAVAWANAVGGGGRQRPARRERPKPVDEIQVVMKIAEIEILVLRIVEIDANDVLAPVLRIVRLKRSIVGGIDVVEDGSLLLHQGIDVGNGLPVGRDALR